MTDGRLVGRHHRSINRRETSRPTTFGPLDEELRLLNHTQASAITRLATTYGPGVVAQRKSIVGMQDLFDDWVVKGYDGHMKGHDEAVKQLFRMLIGAIHRTRMEHGQSPIFDGTVVEASCGTGSVIRSIVDIMSDVDPARLERIRFVANDLSSGMQNQARIKLADVGTVEYMQQDLRELAMVEKPHVVILSQTLHLLTDPVLLERELSGDIARTDHRQIKTHVIRNIFDQLEEGGFFVLVDEWPPKLSRNRSTLDPAIEAAFAEQFRPIDSKADFRDRIMSNVPGARFVTELKVRIDLEHSMTLFVYQKDPIKLGGSYVHLPSTKGDAKRYGMRMCDIRRARMAASERTLDIVRRLDSVFVAGYNPINGERAMWEKVRCISDCSPDRLFDMRKKSTTIPNGEFDVILMADLLHHMNELERRAFFDDAMTKLSLGGAIVVMDMWKPPRRVPYPVSKREIRNQVIEPHEQNLLFEGAVRVPIMPTTFTDAEYAWVYRKVV